MSKLIRFRRQAWLVAAVFLLTTGASGTVPTGNVPTGTVAALQASILSDQVQATPIEVPCTIGDVVSTTACEIDTEQGHRAEARGNPRHVRSHLPPTGTPPVLDRGRQWMRTSGCDLVDRRR